MHDAILVGVGTAINDDPQLNGTHRRHSELRAAFIDVM